MKVWLLLFAFLVAISCASQLGDNPFKKRARKYEDQVDANKVIRLIEADNNPSENEYIEKSSIELFQVDLKKSSSEAYINAIRTKNFNVMENLLTSYHGGLRFIKSTTVKNWNDVLFDAATRGHEEAVRLLLERDENGQYIHKDINPSAINNYAIRYAAFNGHEGIVKLLLESTSFQSFTVVLLMKRNPSL